MIRLQKNCTSISVSSMTCYLRNLITPHNIFGERTSLDGNQENIQAVVDKMANETITIKRMFQKCVFCV